MNYFVEIKSTTNKGRGVFATKNFSSGEIIERCPIVLLSSEDTKYYEQTILHNYLYEWRDDSDDSYTPNATYVRDFDSNEMVYQAIAPVAAGEEITINYNGEPDNPDHIDWFKVQK